MAPVDESIGIDEPLGPAAPATGSAGSAEAVARDGAPSTPPMAIDMSAVLGRVTGADWLVVCGSTLVAIAPPHAHPSPAPSWKTGSGRRCAAASPFRSVRNRDNSGASSLSFEPLLVRSARPRASGRLVRSFWPDQPSSTIAARPFLRCPRCDGCQDGGRCTPLHTHFALRPATLRSRKEHA
eukprot:4758702-Prymnesium_polylepis.1